MPNKLARGCAQTGCPELTRDPSCYCPEHKKLHQTRQDERRGSSSERGYGARWQRVRKHFLNLNPVCEECYKKGIAEPATTVDHIVPHKGNMELFWDQENLQSLCKLHHDRKTATESGWGR